MVARRQAVYTSTARAEVRPLTAAADQYGFYDLQSSMDTEAERVSSTPIANKAYELDAPEGTFATASVPTNTTYLDISCTEPSPEDAQGCANGFARAYVTLRVQQARESYDAAAAPLLQAMAEATTPQDKVTARLQLLALPAPSANAALLSVSAELPVAPSNKGFITTGILAMIVGLALGTGLAFVRERLDERIGGRQDMEKALGAPVLAVVPKVPGWRTATTRAW